jgi:DNA polymerase-1
MKHPIGQALLRFRAVDKEVTAYGDNLLSHVWSDGRIHPNFKQDGARTGRLSCTKPNLQQQARDSGVRKGFIPDPTTFFRFADYSQMEMKFAAHFANDPVLIHGFRHEPDFDVHATTASKMFGVRKPTKKQRKSAKIFNFATLYGAGVAKITSQLVALLTLKEAKRALRELDYTPVPGEPVHRSLATVLRDRYFKEFPGIKRAKYRASDLFEERGFVINAFGRHRFMEENEGYKAFNTEIQGSAADLAKKGIVTMYRELQVRDRSILLLLQIHDEAVYLSDGDPKTDRQVLEILGDDKNFLVPMTADISGSATNWQEKDDIKL